MKQSRRYMQYVLNRIETNHKQQLSSNFNNDDMSFCSLIYVQACVILYEINTKRGDDHTAHLMLNNIRNVLEEEEEKSIGTDVATVGSRRRSGLPLWIIKYIEQKT